MIVEPNQKTRQRKNVSAVALLAEISFQWRLWELPFVLFSVVKKNATQSTVMRVNNKRKHMHQMRVNAHCRTCFLTHVCAKMVHAFCVCVGRLSLTCTVGICTCAYKYLRMCV